MRRLPSRIDGFFEYTENLSSPVLFRKWAAISALAGALERKVWIRSLGSRLYPNLYVILVGPPGVGKTMVTKEVFDLWSQLEEQHVAPSSVTKASLIDALRDAERRVVLPKEVPPVLSFNSLKIASNELGVLIPSYENDFMNTLTDLYDCHPYSERRRTHDLNFSLTAPQLHILAATTPSYLNNVLPEGAWDQGFLSRTLLIYSGESILRPLFDESPGNGKLRADLLADLKSIAHLYGAITFEPEAAAAISAWHMAKGPPQPEHPKLGYYSTRRTAHLLKLCMVACVSSGDTLVVTPEHYQLALDWLLEAESFMPDIFKSMTMGGDSRVMSETWYHVYKLYMKENAPIQEVRIVHFISERAPAHNVARILDIMVRGGILKEEHVNRVGKCYIPKAMKA